MKKIKDTIVAGGFFMRGNIIILFMIFSVFSIFGFTQSELEKLSKDENWIVGWAEADNVSDADKMALEALTSQISIDVQANYRDIFIDENGSVNELTKKVITTFSSSMLTECQKQVIKSKDTFQVWRFIQKSQKDKIFETRKEKAIEYAKVGINREEELEIGSALKAFYWSLLLMKSHPNHYEAKTDFGKEGMRNLFIFLKEQKIPSLLKKIEFQIDEKRDCGEFYEYYV